MPRFRFSVTRAAAAAVLAVALGASACSTGDSPSGASKLSKGQVTLRINWWGTEARLGKTRAAIAAFEDTYPNIKVIDEYSDWNVYWDKLDRAVASGDVPDVIQMDQIYLASYADRGVLADLSRQPQLDTSALPPSILDAGRSKGTLYGMPISASAWGLLVNQAILKDLGLALPDTEKWNWSQFTAFAEAVTEASDGKIHGLTPWSNEYSLQIFARQHGESLFKGGKVTITVGTLAAYFQQAAAWARSGAAQSAPKFAAQATAPLDQTDFATGKVAMTFANVSQLPAYAQAIPKARSDIAAVKLPTEDGNATKYSYLKPGMYWSVSARSKHPAEAESLVNFLVNDTEAGASIGAERGIPANNGILISIRGKLNNDQNKVVDYMYSILNILGTAPEIVPDGASNLDMIILRRLEDVMFGRTPAAAAARSFIAELQLAIDRAK